MIESVQEEWRRKFGCKIAILSLKVLSVCVCVCYEMVCNQKNANRVIFTYYLKIKSYFKDHITVLVHGLENLMGYGDSYDM